MIGEQVRAAEADIDNSIRRLPIWKSEKNRLLKRLMDIWRDGLEVAYARFGHATMFQSSESFDAAIAIEHQVNTGVFWCLKWTFEYASDADITEPTDGDLVNAVMNVGAPYQVLVDALKFANIEGNELEVNINDRMLTVYEGRNTSGYDQAIIDADHISLPFHKQTPLVEDCDQLTKSWTAGECRKYWQGLRSFAEEAETETVLAQAGPLSPQQEMFKRPVILTLHEPPSALRNVQADFTLTQDKIDLGMKWKLSEWQDCPLVQVGTHVCAVSSVVKALSRVEDYMLRVAVLNDRDQYEKISGLREERMIAACKAAFDGAGWSCKPHFRLKTPPREIDLYAAREQQDVIIQLKSTLRPQSPWEVHKRNSDVIDGIKHTADLLQRFRQGALGFVLTDGYEGDYSTWAESLSTRVPVATLRDLGMIATDPVGAFELLAKRAGIEGNAVHQPMPDRLVDLCGWTLRLVDSAKPI